MKSTTVLMIVLCLLSVVNTSGQYKYSARELYDNAEKEFYGFAMNDSGQIAGFFNVRNAGGEIKERHVFLTRPYNSIDLKRDIIDNGKCVSDYPIVYGYTATTRFVNNLGQVVGRVLANDGKYHAFCTRPNKPINLKTDDLGSGDIYPTCINNLGQVAGFRHVPVLKNGNIDYKYVGYFRAFCTKPNKPIDMNTDDLSPILGIESYAWAINDLGQVAGSMRDLRRGEKRIRAFCTRPNKPINLLTDNLNPLANTESCAMGVNNNGQTVGWFTFDNDKTTFYSFRTKSNSPINIKTDTLRRVETSDISSAKNRGDVRMINDDGHAVSCLFPATYFNNGLEQYLQGAISPPCDYKLKYASALNAKGQVIVFGSKPSWPQLHPFLLTPIVAESPSMSGRLQRWDGVKWVPIKDWKDPEIHKEQPTVVITHGWNSSLYCREICSIASQLRTQNSRANILGWNWDSAAVMILSNGKITQDIFDEIYDSGLIGAAKCVQISLAEGNHMAKELQMLKIGPDNLQLIGHSAGASLIGSTASALYASCGGKVRRITALDAPCIVLSEIPQAGWNAPPAQTGLINIHEYDSKIFVKDEGLLSSRADALSHINPAHAYQFENYYSGPPGPAGRKALGFGLPVSKAGNVFNGQIFAGGMILKSLNIKPDHIRIVDWYANTINKKSEVGGFPAGLNWSILSREASNFKPGHYKEIGYDKGVFSNMEQK